jgi:hypothetical protein
MVQDLLERKRHVRYEPDDCEEQQPSPIRKPAIDVLAVLSVILVFLALVALVLLCPLPP